MHVQDKFVRVAILILAPEGAVSVKEDRLHTFDADFLVQRTRCTLDPGQFGVKLVPFGCLKRLTESRLKYDSALNMPNK